MKDFEIPDDVVIDYFDSPKSEPYVEMCKEQRLEEDLPDVLKIALQHLPAGSEEVQSFMTQMKYIEHIREETILAGVKKVVKRINATKANQDKAADHLVVLERTARQVWHEFPARKRRRGLISEEVAERCGGNKGYIQTQLAPLFDKLLKK